MAETNEEEIEPQNKGNKYSFKKRNPKSLWFNSQSKGNLLVFNKHNEIFLFLVSSGETFGVGRVLIPPVIAKNREFGANLVGKYYPRIVPFGPFGFYENLYFTK